VNKLFKYKCQKCGILKSTSTPLCLPCSVRGRKFNKKSKLKITQSLLGNKRRLGIKASEETKEKLSLKRQGRIPAFIDGRTEKRKEWKKLVNARDNDTCQLCGKHKKQLGYKRLHTHHIKSQIEHPELIYEVNNGVTLCNVCHPLCEKESSLLTKKLI